MFYIFQSDPKLIVRMVSVSSAYLPPGLMDATNRFISFRVIPYQQSGWPVSPILPTWSDGFHEPFNIFQSDAILSIIYPVSPGPSSPIKTPYNLKWIKEAPGCQNILHNGNWCPDKAKSAKNLASIFYIQCWSFLFYKGYLLNPPYVPK